MTALHTPGPWKTGDCDSFIIWAASFRSTAWRDSEPGPEAVHVADVQVPCFGRPDRAPEWLDDPEVNERWEAECRANARLIAAAPELLEALERIATVDMGGGFLGAQACREVARAVIAKATGGRS
jgi:hypothetical protein